MNKWIIKFLSGTHQGAQIPLKPGSYTIGCADNDDLILTDVALKENHFTLHLSETSAEISLPKEREPLFIGSDATDPIDNQGDENRVYPIIFPQIITIGTLKMAVGLETEDWQCVSLPEPEKKQDIVIKEEPIIATKEPEKISNKKTSVLKKSVYAGSFISLMFISILFIDNDDTEITEIEPYIPQIQQWEKIKTNIRSENLKFTEDKTSAKIEGRIQTQSDFDQLESILELANIQAKTNIIIDEVLQRMITKEVANLDESTLNVEFGDKAGEFNIKGMTNKPLELDELIKTAIANIPGVIDIKNNTERDNESKNPRNIRMGLNVRSVNVGRTPYFITDDGQKFVSGSRLLSGLVIEDINTQYIQLKKGDDIYLHQLGEN